MEQTPTMTDNNTSATDSNIAFDADIQQLMNLIVNAFYSTKEVFLRELISNASDAINKHKFSQLQTDGSSNACEYFIQVTGSTEDKTLTIEDNGVGMNDIELRTCLGTVAKSGTKSFIKQLKNSKENMIGQFGVGFYSAFLVASHVDVFSKKEDGEMYKWSSDGQTGYTIEKSNDDVPSFVNNHGTRIVLHLKDEPETLQFANENELKKIIKKHSQFIGHPIQVWTTKTREVEVKVEESDAVEGDVTVDADSDDETKVTIDDVSEEMEAASTEKSKPKTVTEKYNEWDTVNKDSPIWTRNEEDVTKEEYESFYKTISNDWSTYAAKTHFSIEGNLQFSSILYLPTNPPFNMFHRNTDQKSNLKLYVRRVLISDECRDLLPDWLDFVSGVVDSYDLPLNVSREILQENKFVPIMQKQLVKKCIASIEKFAEERVEEYNKWYKNFAKSLKLGVHEDTKNQQKLMDLLRYDSSHFEEETHTRTFSEYVENMKEGQPGIYFIAGETREILSHSPFIERLRQKGYEVLYMTDPMDEYMLQRVKEYNGKKLLSVTTVSLEGLDAGEETKENMEETIKYCKDVLGDKVGEVTLSNRTVDSPSCLVTSEHGMSANFERILKAQAMTSHHQSYLFQEKKTLEINPHHSMIQLLHNYVENGNTGVHTEDLVELVYGTAVLTSGFTLKKPHEFSSRIHRIFASMSEKNTETTREDVGENEV